jgi:hypothetical protein
LKQVPRASYSHIEAFFFFKKFLKDVHMTIYIYIFIKIKEGGKMLFVYLYIDDLIYTRNEIAIFEILKGS